MYNFSMDSKQSYLTGPGRPQAITLVDAFVHVIPPIVMNVIPSLNSIRPMNSARHFKAGTFNF